jgi:hypothetical protein
MLNSGDIEFFNAVKTNNLSRVKELCRTTYIDIKKRDEKGNVLLYYCSDPEISLYIKNNTKPKEPKEPKEFKSDDIFNCIIDSREKEVTHLLQTTDIYSTDSKGKNVLFYLKCYGPSTYDIDFAIKHNIKQLKQEFIYYVSESSIRQIILNNDADYLADIMEGSYKPYPFGLLYETVMNFAAEHVATFSSFNIIENLIKYGCELGKKDKKGNTPLHYLMRHADRVFYREFIFKFFIDNIDVNALNLENKRPLDMALNIDKKTLVSFKNKGFIKSKKTYCVIM